MSTTTNKKRVIKPTIEKSSKVIIALSQKEKQYIEKLTKTQIQKIIDIFANAEENDEEKPIRISVLTSNLPDHVKMKYFKSLAYNDSDKFFSLVKSSIEIPFNNFIVPQNKKPKIFLDNACNVMDTYITGHCEAKKEVLKLLCQWKNGALGCNYAIGLEGKPGTGKTTFVKHAFAEATGLPMVFISLGGCTDASYLLGNCYTYEGSTYGRLVNGLIDSKCSNPIFYFDELDKISNSPKGEEIVNTLIHLIDPAQNSHIRDKYFSFDIDFSKCVFIFSYNDPEKVSPILLDRIKRIKLENPTNDEKMLIIKKHIIPRALARVNIKHTFDDEALNFILTRNETEVGMRSIEKDIDHIISCASLTKSYGSLSILGIDKSYKLTKVIGINFVKDVMKDAEKKDEAIIGMMYT